MFVNVEVHTFEARCIYKFNSLQGKDSEIEITFTLIQVYFSKLTQCAASCPVSQIETICQTHVKVRPINRS